MPETTALRVLACSRQANPKNATTNQRYILVGTCKYRLCTYDILLYSWEELCTETYKVFSERQAHGYEGSGCLASGAAADVCGALLEVGGQQSAQLLGTGGHGTEGGMVGCDGTSTCTVDSKRS